MDSGLSRCNASASRGETGVAILVIATLAVLAAGATFGQTRTTTSDCTFPAGHHDPEPASPQSVMPSHFEGPFCKYESECGEANFVSRCWLGWFGCDCAVAWRPPGGLPLKIGLWDALGAPDLPPVSADPVLGTEPLVPARSKRRGLRRLVAERPVLSGTVDLVTGRPLYREVDFELPFGGAVFRHVRTFGYPVARNWEWAPVGFGRNVSAHMWDWNGRFWMMGENPILLIDAAYERIAPQGHRICYFVPDAHHSIPFISEGPNQPYRSPDWTDAVLAPDSDGIHWYVYTQGGALKYTFRAPPESQRDIWSYPLDEGDPASCVSVHEQHGFPYYALLESVEDRYGNRVVNHYCAFREYVDPNMALDPAGGFDPNCVPCTQNCNEKGQLTGVELITADGEVVWTLLYVYRSFASCDEGWGGARTRSMHTNRHDERLSEHMLHAVYVYPGPMAGVDECRTIPARAFAGIDSFDGYEAVDDSAWVTIPPGWVTCARYMYEEVGQWWYDCRGGSCATPCVPHDPNDPNYGCGPCDPNVPGSPCAGGGGGAYATSFTWPGCPELSSDSPYYQAGPQRTEDGWNGPGAVTGDYGYRLLKATVIQQDVLGQKQRRQSTMYRYDDDMEHMGGHAHESWPYFDLQLVFYDRTLRKITSAVGGSNENIVFTLFSNQSVTITDGDETVTAPLYQLADLYFGPDRGDDEAFFDPSSERIAFAELPLHRLFLDDSWGTHREFRDRRGSNRRYVLYRALFLPEDAWGGRPPGAGPVWYVNWATGMDTLYHWPYRYVDYHGNCVDPCDPTTCDFTIEFSPTDEANRVFFASIIYEYDLEDPAATDPQEGVLKSKRVVEVLPNGVILRDRTWAVEDGDETLVSQVGFGEHYVYDEYGRLSERRSAGWSAAQASGEDTTQVGLIYTYAYTDPSGNPNGRNYSPGELKRVRVQRGTAAAGGARPLLFREYGDARRPDLVTRELRFAVSQADPNATSASGPYSETRVSYTCYDGRSGKPVQTKETRRRIGPQALHGEDAWHVRKEFYDVNGNLVWTLEGTEDAGGGLVESYLNYTEYDERGRKRREIIDADLSRVAASPPAGWQRNSTAPPLHLETTYDYEDPFGLKTVRLPNGREQWILYEDRGDGTFVQWIFKEVVPDAAGGQARVLGPVVVNDFEGAELVRTQEWSYPAPIPYPPEVPLTGGTLLSESTPTYDAAGRLTGMQRSDPSSGDAISATVAYHWTGQILRQQAPDGTITRNVYDELGRLKAVYQGTSDNHPYWGTLPPDANESLITDDLVLVEKRYYGEGVHDAGKLVQKRRYRSPPIDQYFEGDPNDPNLVLNNEDQIGIPTYYHYDWRMRQVWAEQHNRQGQPVRHTLTWYDNLDRVRFVATYGPQAPAGTSIDPRACGPGQCEPTAQQILATAPPPRTLEENIYDPAGQVYERRIYQINADDPASSTYSSTITCYNFRGQPIEVHTAGGAVQKYVYDAKGRQIRSSTWAAGTELSRTETSYDDQDRPIVTIHYERTANLDPNAGPLDGNAVARYSRSWYDKAGRIIARADFGTNNDAGFVNGTAPACLDDPNCTVAEAQAAGALVTQYQYDEAGRQSRVIHPDGSETHYEYDSLGRLRLLTENATGPAAQIRRTAYDYDPQTGQLVRIAAVLPGHAGTGGQGVATFDDIDWNATDGTLQITQIVYGAPVVGGDGVAVSAHNGRIAAVHYPDPDTGQPRTAPSITFAYDFAGNVRERTDARGIMLELLYDLNDRLAAALVHDAAWFATLSESLRPESRVAQIEATWRDDGRLERVRAWGLPDGSPGSAAPGPNAPGEPNLAGVEIDPNQPGDYSLLGEVVYSYDPAGNLEADTQAHFKFASGSTPAVRYQWQLGPTSIPGASYPRLAAIEYPARPGELTGRTLAIRYGDAGSPADYLGWITAIDDSQFGRIASYAYCGTGRRVALALGGDIGSGVVGQSLGATPVGLLALDRFGRLADLHYTDTGGQTLFRAEYRYDAAGRRSSARITQWLTDTSDNVNRRSWLYAYNRLGQLVAAEMGSLNAAGDAIIDDPATPLRRQLSYALDVLGNFNAADATTGSLVRRDDTDGDTAGGWESVERIHHDTAADNTIRQIATTDTTGTQSTATLVYDAAGNVVFDGQYLYQYDAFNRLVRIDPAPAA